MTQATTQPSILIVGAGAMGLVSGYHLSLGGAKITFMVRPGRRDAFLPPQTLYCYDDARLKLFDGYDVIERMSDAAGRNFDYVVVTLDGATARSNDGTQVLKDIGTFVRDSDTKVLMGGVGVGLRQHYLEATGLPEDRVFSAILGLLAHQVSANLPVNPPTDPALLAKAGVAYRHSSNRIGLLIEKRNPAAARDFTQIYNRCGISRGAQMSSTLVDIVSNSVFPMFAASQIAGWPDIARLAANKSLWQLACRAQGEIMALPQHGWLGKLMRLVMTPGMTAKLHLKLEREMWPLNYQAFNRYHHGGKVHAQDVQVMENCVADGLRQGRAMTALKELLAQLAASETAGEPAPAATTA